MLHPVASGSEKALLHITISNDALSHSHNRSCDVNNFSETEQHGKNQDKTMNRLGHIDSLQTGMVW